MAFDPADLAEGQVVTGFAWPMVALYNNNGGTVTYTGGMPLARGVSVRPNIETAGNDRDFSANNRTAETAPRRFTRGSADYTVDGVLYAAEALIMGLPQSAHKTLTIGSGAGAQTLGVTGYGEAQKIPYVGVGAVVRSQSNGIVLYRAWVYTKARFDQYTVPAATEGQQIDWQTTDLTAQLARDDTAEHNWQMVSDVTDDELLAYNALRVMLGMEPAAALPAE